MTSSPHAFDSHNGTPSLAPGGRLPEPASRIALTEVQREIYWASLDPQASCAYATSIQLTLDGPVDDERLERALRAVIGRAPALRSTLSEDGEWMYPNQISDLPIARKDLRTHPETERAGALAEVIAEDGLVPFDPIAGPLARLLWIRCNDERCVIVLTGYAAVLDQRGATKLIAELGEAYRAGGQDVEPYQPQGKTQPAQASSEAHMQYWQNRFETTASGFNLPTDFHRPLSRSFRSFSFAGGLDRELTSNLQAFAAQSSLSLEELLVSSFAMMMHRLSGEDTALLLLSTSAEAVEGVSKLLPLFTRMPEGVTTREFLRSTRAVLTEARQHAEFGYESLLRRMQLDRGAELAPAIEVQISLETIETDLLFEGIGAQVSWTPRRAIAKDLTLSLLHAGSDVNFSCDYNRDLFAAGTVERWMAGWLRLLRGMIAGPETRVDDLPLLSDDERTMIVRDWNCTAKDWGPFESLPAVFLRRAADEPNRIAVECGGVAWTNQELRSYAQALARKLRAQGVKTDELVGIAAERSPEMLGAVLGVLMAGAAYLPLDIRHPKERLEGILEDGGARFLLTTEELRLNGSLKVLQLERGRPADGSAFDSSLPLIQPKSLAYVSFTSGSTGKPKGAAIEHASSINLLRSMAESPGLGGHDVLLAISTLAFDMSAVELMLPLFTGAKLVIATEAELANGGSLLSRLQESGVTFLQATPGHLRLLLDAGWSPAHKLKCLCGAEPMSLDLAEKLLERTTELWNLYGPTEATVWCSATRVREAAFATRIGPPLTNYEIYVLDRRLHPVPVGVVGELYLGGIGLAREYWKRPELTAAKFVPSPFHAPNSGARIYATGDLARFLPDGSVELRGRADFQVKVAGNRVELGEIEATLAADGRVLEAVVLPEKGATAQSTNLIAYVAVREPKGDATGALVEALKERVALSLPRYMHPSLLIPVPAIPRTLNGKIDRKALPRPDLERASETVPEEMREATDLIESQLLDLWRSVLGIPHIGFTTSFFSLGFGSLVALRLVTRVNRAFDVRLGIASLVSAPTIEELAQVIRARFAPNTLSSVVPLKTGGSRRPVFLIHGIGGNIVTFYGLSARMDQDQPVYAIQAQSLVGHQPALLRLEDMAATYVADVRTIQPEGPYNLVGYSFGGTVALEMAHQLRDAGQEVSLLGMIDSRTNRHSETVATLTGVQTRFSRRMVRFHGNTVEMPLHKRASYVMGKLYTRLLRVLCVAACRLRLRQVPAFMRSTWDINHVALANYAERPYDGRMVLFVPSDQPAPRGPEDLGWHEIFTEGVEMHELPGDHDRIFLEPNIDRMVISLAECLARSSRLERLPINPSKHLDDVYVASA